MSDSKKKTKRADQCVFQDCKDTATQWVMQWDEVAYAMCNRHALQIAAAHPKMIKQLEPINA